MKPLVLVIWWWWWGTIEMQIFAMMKEIWQLISAKTKYFDNSRPWPWWRGEIHRWQLTGNVWCVIFRTITLLGPTIAFCPPSHNIHHSSQINFHHCIQGRLSATKYHYYESLFTAAPLVQRNKRSAKEQRTNLPASNRNFSPPKMNFDALPSSERYGCFRCRRFGALCFFVSGSESQRVLITTVEKAFPSSDSNILTSVIITFVFDIYDHTTK